MNEVLVGINEQPQATPRLEWDLGAGYDLFISLDVLHHPGLFGLRASWAAGVRSRLSVEERKILENAKLLIQEGLR